ncbi:hypothetical protein PZB74_03805 [Porifericola rhodea]|uniref:hypothetical protein n=1 Tax=Porifericola rhodea TaxID=930972 RepID=UPI0026659D39|nr:hypothetical protein [Porifericola rhodea]WKN32471.1 hypothetical protein PZB74_03805 [Porifericola rhodea]
MKSKSVYGLFMLIIAVSILATSCQSSKIAYGNSYYFKQTPKVAEAPATQKAEIVEKLERQPIAEQELQASISKKEVASVEVEEMMQSAQEHLDQTVAKSENQALKKQAEHISALAKEAKSAQLTKKEQRAKRKELRKELKEMVKEYKATAPQAKNGLSDLDKNLRLAIIFWGAGLILSILGYTVPFIWVLASLAWLAGTVFFIIWLVEELG